MNYLIKHFLNTLDIKPKYVFVFCVLFFFNKTTTTQKTMRNCAEQNQSFLEPLYPRIQTLYFFFLG